MKQVYSTTSNGESVKVKLNTINELIKDRAGYIFAFIDNDQEEYTINPGQLDEKSVVPNLKIYRHELDTTKPEKLFVDLKKSKNLETVYIDYYLLDTKNIKTFSKIKTIYISHGDKEVLKNLFPTYQISKSNYDNVLKLTKNKSNNVSKKNCKKYACTVKPRIGEFCSKHKNS